MLSDRLDGLHIGRVATHLIRVVVVCEKHVLMLVLLRLKLFLLLDVLLFGILLSFVAHVAIFETVLVGKDIVVFGSVGSHI